MGISVERCENKRIPNATRVQNTNKYASATTVNVDLNQLDNHLILKISDDGVGFNVKNTKKGIGLQNIIYRTNECSGVVTIESKRRRNNHNYYTTDSLKQIIKRNMIDSVDNEKIKKIY
jgi:signal transduction histidine kinase